MSNSFPGIIAAEKCQSKVGRLVYVNITDPLLVGRTGFFCYGIRALRSTDRSGIYSSYSVVSSIPASCRASLRSTQVPHFPQCFSPPL